MRARPQWLIPGLLATLLAGWPLEEAEAQAVSIPAAVALVGGGVAAAIGNGLRAAKGLPPEDLWDDAGWFIGGLDLIIGTAFLIDAGVSAEPIWGALPIGIAVTTIGVAALSMTAWVVAGAPDVNDDWLLTPALYQDQDGAFVPGVAFSLRSF
jgi:hypothetical protein